VHVGVFVCSFTVLLPFDGEISMYIKLNADGALGGQICTVLPELLGRSYVVGNAHLRHLALSYRSQIERSSTTVVV